MKKSLVFLTAIAMLFALAACGGGATPSGAPAGNATPSGAPAGNVTPSEAPTGNATPSEAPTLDWPKKDITIVVPYAAGGNTDLFVRAMTSKMSELMGVNVVVSNVEGGGGATGTSQVVNGKADGYSLVVPANSAYVLNSQVNQLGYTAEETTPICIISEAEFGIGVATDSPYQTLEDLMNAAKSEPLTYATPGTNSAGHLVTAAVGTDSGVPFENWKHAPIASAPSAIAELIGGHTDAYCSNLSVFKTSVENGDIRLLAVTGSERQEKYPDVPTFKELGFDYPVSVYFALVGPKDMDPAVTQYISNVVEETLQDAAVIEAFENLDQPIAFTGAEEFATRLTEDVALYNGLLKDIGIIK